MWTGAKLGRSKGGGDCVYSERFEAKEKGYSRNAKVMGGRTLTRGKTTNAAAVRAKRERVISSVADGEYDGLKGRFLPRHGAVHWALQ